MSNRNDFIFQVDVDSVSLAVHHSQSNQRRAKTTKTRVERETESRLFKWNVKWKKERKIWRKTHLASVERSETGRRLRRGRRRSSGLWTAIATRKQPKSDYWPKDWPEPLVGPFRPSRPLPAHFKVQLCSTDWQGRVEERKEKLERV